MGAGAYLADRWRLWPKLLITSPTRQCGKSTLMEVLEALLPRALLASNASTAAIFRAIETFKPSLLLDEADTWLRQNEELAGIVNSGHTRRTATVLRVVEAGGQHEVRKFSTWGPMVVAGIGDQRDTLTSRSIVIGLRRKLPTETVERLASDLFDRSLGLRRRAARWAADNGITIGAMDLEPPPCGDDRRRDNFGPLYRLAHVLGGDWPARVAAGYLAAAEGHDDAEDAGVMLRRDLVELFDRRGAERLPSNEIVAALVEMEDRPWGEWRHGRPATPQTVAKLLKPFGIRSKVLKLAGAPARLYQRHEVEAAAARYATAPPAPSRNPVTPEQNQEVAVVLTRNPAAEVTPKKPRNPLNGNAGYEVARRSEGWGDFYANADPGAHHADAPG